MKILLLSDGSYEDYRIIGLFSHPVDHHWSEGTLRDEFHALSGFSAPVYQVAENPTPQQAADGDRTQWALRLQAIKKHWGSPAAYETAFRAWLTGSKGFVPVAWEEI